LSSLHIFFSSELFSTSSFLLRSLSPKSMAEPPVPPETSVPSEPPVPLTRLERFESWLEQRIVSISHFYRTAHLLTAQILLSFASATICGFQIRNQRQNFRTATITTAAIGLVYLLTLCGIFV
ncbi:unnamed protein product, partial [Arabidopsis halleri]